MTFNPDVCRRAGVREKLERGFTMIATHNIKVNGRWVQAGEKYQTGPEQMSLFETEQEKAPQRPEKVEEEVQAEPAAPEAGGEKAEETAKAPTAAKPKTSRRKKA